MNLSSFLRKAKHLLIALGAYWYYGRPARHLVVIGVTGTKGKSTTCRLIASILQAAGNKVGMLTTVEFQIGEQSWTNDKKMTMLGLGQIQKMLKQMVKAGCRYAVVETSSEGILQYRHCGLNYDIAVFTNLGTEHSERHGGFENLRRDKGKMFAALGGRYKVVATQKIRKAIVANIDDPEASYYLSFKADDKYCFGLSAPSVSGGRMCIAKEWKTNAKGSSFTIDDELYHIYLPGKFNVYNALAAIAVAKSQELDAKVIRRGLDSVTGVPGRMEFINEGQNYQVVVDYAHEPLSFKGLFETLRILAGQNKKIIAVIGSDGGGRDQSKREEMGKIAGELADVVVVTDVNCFDEDPQKIADMLAAGARHSGRVDGKDLFVEINRERAFELAFKLAKAGDVVALTAKGTEPCICVAKGQKIPWDDRQAARTVIKKLIHESSQKA